MVPQHTSHSKVELQTKLNNPWIVARGDDAAEVARIEDPPRCWVNAAARGNEGIQVADWLGDVRAIEQIEELSAKCEIAIFGERRDLTERKSHIHFARAAETVPTHISDICAHVAGCRHATGTGK